MKNNNIKITEERYLALIAAEEKVLAMQEEISELRQGYIQACQPKEQTRMLSKEIYNWLKKELKVSHNGTMEMVLTRRENICLDFQTKFMGNSVSALQKDPRDWVTEDVDRGVRCKQMVDWLRKTLLPFTSEPTTEDVCQAFSNEFAPKLMNADGSFNWQVPAQLKEYAQNDVDVSLKAAEEQSMPKVTLMVDGKEMQPSTGLKPKEVVVALNHMGVAVILNLTEGEVEENLAYTSFDYRQQKQIIDNPSKYGLETCSDGWVSASIEDVDKLTPVRPYVLYLAERDGSTLRIKKLLTDALYDYVYDADENIKPDENDEWNWAGNATTVLAEEAADNDEDVTLTVFCHRADECAILSDDKLATAKQKALADDGGKALYEYLYGLIVSKSITKHKFTGIAQLKPTYLTIYDAVMNSAGKITLKRQTCDLANVYWNKNIKPAGV